MVPPPGIVASRPSLVSGWPAAVALFCTAFGSVGAVKADQRGASHCERGEELVAEATSPTARASVCSTENGTWLRIEGRRTCSAKLSDSLRFRATADWVQRGRVGITWGAGTDIVVFHLFDADCKLLLTDQARDLVSSKSGRYAAAFHRTFDEPGSSVWLYDLRRGTLLKKFILPGGAMFLGSIEWRDRERQVVVRYSRDDVSPEVITTFTR